jgi:hypothetical protein
MRRTESFVHAYRRSFLSVSTNRYCNNNHLIELVIIVLILTVVSQAIGADPLVPPPLPDVPPFISETYSSDENSNHIQDKLEIPAGTRPLPPSPIGPIEPPPIIEPPVIEMVDVQLTFSTQITQQQIDDFLGIGGEITYIYKSISYGWRGRIPESNIKLLPDLMGPTMVIVEEPPKMVLDMDIATQTGRVRPIWLQGFAGNPSGFNGDESITIGFIDTGIDASHQDLSDRKAYWHDFSDEGYENPIDIEQHGTHIAGIALGMRKGRLDEERLFYNISYTEIGNLEYVQENSFLPSPIQLISGKYTFTSRAEWIGGGQTLLYHVSRPKGNMTKSWSAVSDPVSGRSGLLLSSSIDLSDDTLYATALLSTGGSVRDFVITNSVRGTVYQYLSNFRGVAPECRWAAAKYKSSQNNESFANIALQRLVNNRVNLNIKIVNISLSVSKEYNGGIADSLRAEVNSAVNNGILVVVSAGNNGRESIRRDREISDPGNAEMALTVGACNDRNQLTDYSSQGIDLRPLNFEPEPSTGIGHKPDLIAPGGSYYDDYYYTGIMSIDSGSSDGPAFDDKQSNDYRNAIGTSMATAFTAGCAALVIDAMQQKGIQWDFYSSYHPRYVKMVLCATATETNADRENDMFNPTLQQASDGPNGFPRGKDQYEGYGIINPDAAVEAVYLTHGWGTEENCTLGSGPYDRRAWARTVRLSAGSTYLINLYTSIAPVAPVISDANNLIAIPPGQETSGSDVDFDLYLYSAEPSPTGTPEILTASTTEKPIGRSKEYAKSILYRATDDSNALLVVKRVSGPRGNFRLESWAIRP